jgi:glycosyltransferase involved in cell wall biosynthesis
MKISVKVLMFVSNAFVSDPRVYNEARSLIKAGYKVTVIAWDREKENPPRQDWDGIQVIRLRTKLPLYYGFASWLWLGLNLLSWQWQAYRQSIVLHRKTCFDVIHCHDLDTLPIGIRLRRKLGLPLIYDAHEIYGYMISGTYPGWVVNLFLWLEKRLISRVDKIINVCEPQKEYFNGITKKPVTLIMNCKQLQTPEYQPTDGKSNFTLLYIGVLDQRRSVPMLIKAVKELSDVRCLIGGTGLPGYIQALEEECSNTSNVTFLGRVPFDEVIPMTKEADCVFLMLSPKDLNNRLAFANKQFEAMVCGRPIICTRGTHSGDVTEQEQVGLSVEYSKEALKEAITTLRDDVQLREQLGKNALRAAITKYNWQKQEETLLELYRSLQANPSKKKMRVHE